MSKASGPFPDLVFASPRRLPNASELRGRVVVLDVAFASDNLGKGFTKTTGKFIERLGARLACWVDHHDHPRHAEFKADERFVLHTKAEHGACPEIITEDMVRNVGPVDTVVAHFDLDGLYSAAKWLLGGKEPYPGADDDARCVDTRIGTPSEKAQLVDNALRAGYRESGLLPLIVRWLIEGQPKGAEQERIQGWADKYAVMAANSAQIAKRYEVADGIAQVDLGSGEGPFDKTELLLLGQKIATVSVVADNGNVSIAAPFDSGLNFVELLDLGGGMPTRVNIPKKRLADALVVIKAALVERG